MLQGYIMIFSSALLSFKLSLPLKSNFKNTKIKRQPFFMKTSLLMLKTKRHSFIYIKRKNHCAEHYWSLKDKKKIPPS